MNFTRTWHGRQQRVTKHSVVKLGIVFPTPYLHFIYLRQPAVPQGDDNITLIARSSHCSLLSWSVLVPSHTQSGACMNINKCLEQVFPAQLGFHTAVENEFLWSLVRKQCSSKTNKNLKPNETKKMVSPLK